jgi:hypothetical protein
MRTTLLALLILMAACAERPGTMPATPTTSDRTAAAVPSPAPSGGLAVVLTGAPLVTDGGVTWCAGSVGSGDCAGIPVTGLPDGTVEGFERSPVWRVEGVYDGVTAQATAAPEPVDRTEPDFTTPCEDLRGLSSEMGSMDQAASDAVEQYLATIPERHAATWWDQRNAVVTVLLTGDDVTEHRAALQEAVGDRGTVCVIGGARWSAAELDQAQQRALEIAQAEGMGPWSSGTDAVANRVDLEVERSDDASVSRIAQEAGEAVRVHAFIAVRDGTLADLPAPPARGDVELETARTRGGAGMTALGIFTLRFDEEQRCVYGEFGQERIGVIWPFGYYAESGPLRVYDSGGQLVAREGDRLEAGGGQVPRDSGQVCGASEVWVMNGRPEVAGPSEG